MKLNTPFKETFISDILMEHVVSLLVGLFFAISYTFLRKSVPYYLYIFIFAGYVIQNSSVWIISKNYLRNNSNNDLYLVENRLEVSRMTSDIIKVVLIEMRNIYFLREDDFYYFKVMYHGGTHDIFTSLCINIKDKKKIIEALKNDLVREKKFLPLI